MARKKYSSHVSLEGEKNCYLFRKQIIKITYYYQSSIPTHSMNFYLHKIMYVFLFQYAHVLTLVGTDGELKVRSEFCAFKVNFVYV
jgi:hypothetical protein